LADHELGFRKSSQYLEWKRLLHKFYDPFPTVLHYETVAGGISQNSFNPSGFAAG
jgi:hypothetical protein